MTEQKVKEIEEQAEKGDAEAQCDLGLMYLRGIGKSKVHGEAYHWFCEASVERAERREKPNARAGFYLGWMHHKGLVKESKDGDNARIAWRWFTQAAKAGIGEAMILIAKIGLEGKTYSHDFRTSYEERCEPDNTPDLTKPYFWALVALNRGYPEADKLVEKLEYNLSKEEIAETQNKAEGGNRIIPNKMEKLKILEDKLFGDYKNTDDYKGTDDSLLFQ